MKVAIVRGPGLSKWEMQIYEPLASRFDLVAIGSTRPVNDIKGITFPVQLLDCPVQLIQSWPYVIPTAFHMWGDTQWLSNFDKTVVNADLIHTVELRNGYSYQAVQAKKKGLVKAVTVSVYENIPFITDHIFRRKQIKDEVIALTDHFFAVNTFAKQALLCEGVPERRISIVPQAINTERFKPSAGRKKIIRQRLKSASTDIVILGCGRLVWEKGIYDFVRAAAFIQQVPSLLKDKSKLRFIWVGDGPERQRLAKLISQLGLSEIVYLVGAIPYAQMPDYFQAADIFVLPSIGTRMWNEQFGGVLIEAMASSLPIVGTDNGGIAETIGGTGNVIVPQQNFAALAHAIARFAHNLSVARQIGKRNRKKALEAYDIKKVSQSIGKLWSKILHTTTNE